MKRFLLPALLSAISLNAQTAAVPASYQDLYSTLTTQISSFESTIHASWNGTSSPVTYAPQLIGADSTQFTQLLAQGYYQNVVLVQLDQLHALGSEAVTVHISFPILYQPFYTATNNAALYQQFINFYQQLAADIRARNMKLIVESVVGTPFAGNSAASFTSYLEGLSWTNYQTGRAQNALNVAQLIRPEYMSIITEPDTEASASGQTNAGTPSGSLQLLQTILAALKEGNVTNVQVGAGAGTWINSFTQYVQNFTGTSINYFDMHVYPVNNNFLTNILTASDTAHAAGKQVAMSEAWDYKVRNSELGKLNYNQLYARDPFSFWAPIDATFLQAMADCANYKQFLFLAPFWSHYFSAYIDYNTYGTQSDTQIMDASYVATENANLAGKFTSTGLAWLNRTLPAPDTSAPATPGEPTSQATLPNSVPLTWDATTDNVGVAGYNVYRNGTLVTTTSLLNFSDSGLTPATNYTYTINAFDASGNVSHNSTALKTQTFNNIAPTVPGKLTASATSKSSVALNWTASTGAGGVGGYHVLRGTTASNLAPLANTLSASFTDVNCKSSTTYYYAVESYNPAGVASAATAPVSVTTPSK